MKKLSFALSAAMVLGMLPGMVAAKSADLPPGQLVKAHSSAAVYYIDADLHRYVFANAHVFASWYDGFDKVVEVADTDISAYPIGGNVPYKAGKRLVKLQTDPKVYAVDDGGVLRWVKNEQVAKALYGEHWNAFVDDLSDAFFANYTVGDDIDADTDFDVHQQDRIKGIDHALRSERLKHHDDDDDAEATDEAEHEGFGKDKVAVCQNFGSNNPHTIYIAEPAVQAHLNQGATLGKCAGDEGDDDEGNGGTADTVAPTVSAIEISDITDASAKVSFHTSEDTTAVVYYSTASPVNLATAGSKAATDLGDGHHVALTDLHDETTYYVVIVAKDAAGNTKTTSESSFTTHATDTVAPTVSDIVINDITAAAAKVRFHSNEDTTAVVYYSTASPVDLDTAGHKAATDLDDSHTVTLTDLHDETTYYVVIVAKDAAGNTKTTSETSFTTLAAI